MMTDDNQTRTQDMIQHIKLLNNALSLNLYHAAKAWLDYILEDMEVLEAEAESLIEDIDQRKEELRETINLNNFDKVGGGTRYVSKGITNNGLEGVLLFYPTSNRGIDANEAIDFCIGKEL